MPFRSPGGVGGFGNVRLQVYGPSVGEHSRDQLYGPTGQRLREGQVAVSPDILRRYPLGSTIIVNGKPYTVGDVSYTRPGHPNTNTVEIWNGDPKMVDAAQDRATIGGGNPAGQRQSAPQEAKVADNTWQTSPNDRRFLPNPGPTVEIPTGSTPSSGNFLDINAADTSQDPGGISPSGDISIGGDTSLGSDLKTDFTGPQYGEPLTPEPAYQPTGSVFDEIPVTDYGAPNAANEWWKSENWVTSDATASAGAGAGGSIWSDIPAQQAGPTVTLNDANAPTIGGTASTPTALPTPTPQTTVPPTGNGRPPSPIDNPNADYTGSDYPATQDPAGFDIRNHYDTNTSGNGPGNFGGDLTLGNYLNMPLWQMRFGEGYPGVGSGDVIYAGASTHAPAIDPTTGQPYDLSTIPEATAGNGSNSTYPEIRRGELVPDPSGNFSSDANAPGGINLNVDFSGGDRYAGTYYDIGTGHFEHIHDQNDPAQDQSFSASKNGGAEFYTAFDPPKSGMGHTSDEGHQVYWPAIQRSKIRSLSTPTSRAWSQLITTAQGRASLQNRGLANLLTPPPATAGGHG